MAHPHHQCDRCGEAATLRLYHRDEHAPVVDHHACDDHALAMIHGLLYEETNVRVQSLIHEAPRYTVWAYASNGSVDGTWVPHLFDLSMREAEKVKARLSRSDVLAQITQTDDKLT